MKITKEDLLLLHQIVSTPSVSGKEYHMNSKLYQYCKNRGFVVNIDNIGNIIASKVNPKNEYTLLFVAHKDKIGFINKKIHTSGLVELAKVGGIFPFRIFNARLMHYNKEVRMIGTLKVNLDMKNPYKSKYFADFNYLSSPDVLDEMKKFIKIGDPIMFYPIFTLTKNHIISTYLDNSIGVFTCLKVLDYFSKNNSDVNIVVAFSSQEEVGLRGVKSILERVNPDLTVIIDTTGVSEVVRVGKGPAIILFDYGLILPSHIQERLEEIAKKNKLPYQLEVYDGGGTSDWKVASMEGYLTLPIGLPTKNLHSPIETVSIDDLENLINYVIEIANNSNIFIDPKQIETIQIKGKLECPNCYNIKLLKQLKEKKENFRRNIIL